MARFESEGTWFSKEAEAKRAEERWRKQTGWHRFTRAGYGAGGGLAPGATCGPATVSFPHGDSTPRAPKPGEVVGHFYNHKTGGIDTLRDHDRELARGLARYHARCAKAVEQLRFVYEERDRAGVTRDVALLQLASYHHAVGAILHKLDADR